MQSNEKPQEQSPENDLSEADHGEQGDGSPGLTDEELETRPDQPTKRAG